MFGKKTVQRSSTALGMINAFSICSALQRNVGMDAMESNQLFQKIMAKESCTLASSHVNFDLVSGN